MEQEARRLTSGGKIENRGERSLSTKVEEGLWKTRYRRWAEVMGGGGGGVVSERREENVGSRQERIL